MVEGVGPGLGRNRPKDERQRWTDLVAMVKRDGCT